LNFLGIDLAALKKPIEEVRVRENGGWGN